MQRFWLSTLRVPVAGHYWTHFDNRTMLEEDRPIEGQYQKYLIRKTLDGQLTPRAAAPKLAAVTLGDPVPDVHDEEVEGELLGSMERMFNYMIRPLGERPEDVQTIFELLVCLSQLPQVFTKSGQPLYRSDTDQYVWKDMPYLPFALGHQWTGESICIFDMVT